MTKAEYAKYLRSEHWRQFRTQAQKKLPRICACGGGAGLNLHHMTYEHLGQERLTDVAWLCRDCHHALHQDDPSGGLFDVERAATYAAKRPDLRAEPPGRKPVSNPRKGRSARKQRPVVELEPHQQELVKKYGLGLAKRSQYWHRKAA